jgi:hypothetical protein
VTFARDLLGRGPGVATASLLIGQSLAPSTQHAYQRLWRKFGEFCRTAHREELPATPATVCAFLGRLFETEAVRGTSLRPYVAAIGAQHRRFGLPDPTTNELVVLARRGFAAADARRRTGAPPRSAAYPANAAAFCLGQALAATTGRVLRYWAAVCVGFLLSARPGSVLGLAPADVRVEPTWVTLQLRIFKYGTSGVAPRISLLIPTAGPGDPIRQLFIRLVATPRAAGHASATSPWFQRGDLADATAAGLRAVSAHPPPGARFTPRSLRSGGITAAYSVGVPMERIMRLSNHSSVAVVIRHYLDPLVPPSPAARVFFSRFVPSHPSRSLPLPAAPVSPSIGNPRPAEPASP